MKDFLNRILNHEQLTREETKQILLGITRSEYPDEQITALLTGLQMRGVSVDELLGFRDGILETGVAAPLHHERYIDVVGTGGDRKNTFNISTTACFVIAGAGYKVAKHGNYAATSTSGASNVIANHGVRFTDGHRLPPCAALCQGNEVCRTYPQGTAIPHGVQPSGADCKPVAAQVPAAGRGNASADAPLQQRLREDRHRLYYGIVHSIDGYDEISLTGDFKVHTNDYERVFSPGDLGFQIAKPEELVGGATEEEAAAIFDSVLENRALPAQKNIVLANAAFGIQVLEKGSKSVEECIDIARESIDSGRALATFRRFVEINS